MKHKIQIFVLDDDEDITNVIGTLFEENGINNFTLFNDPETMLKALNNDVHICIIDHYLRNSINGLELIKKINKSNRYCYFIMVSGVADKIIIVDYLNSIYGGRYVDKADRNFVEEILFHTKDLMKHVNYIDKFYLKGTEE